jgi:hypothetical protein
MTYGSTSSHIDRAASPAPNVDLQVEAVEIIQQIRTLFKDDQVATLVLNGWNNGMTEAELQKLTGLSKAAYDAARKRLRRKVEPWRPQKMSRRRNGRCPKS